MSNAKTRNLTNQLLTLLQQYHLLSAQQFLKLLAEAESTYNKTSVYRALDRLLSEGKICQYIFDGKEAVYELRNHHHDHAICEQCGTIAMVECQTEAAPIKNFTIDHHHTLIYGLCDQCHSAKTVS